MLAVWGGVRPDERNPIFALSGLQVAASTIKDVELLTGAFRTGRGVDWGDHHGDPFGGTDRFRLNSIGNLVEPRAGDRPEDNLNSVGRILDAASTLICVPGSRSREVGLAVGAQAGKARIRDVATQGGFTRFRRAAETPFHPVYEARP